jgi:adenosylcobinamide amidohydrolase
MEKRKIEIDIESATAAVFYHQIDYCEVKTLVVDFGRKCRMLSTTCGYGTFRYAANHYIPPSLWEYNLDHFDEYLDRVYDSLYIDRKDISMLATGVDMDLFYLSCLNHNDLKVCCLATAGVNCNALRMGVDTCQVEGPSRTRSIPGTINTIVFSNANFTDGAMAMAITNVAEAKAGVLQDLNVRSTFTPQNVATGTGTDAVIIVSGTEIGVNSTSGHVKVGELIGRTVREAVIGALNMQNGFGGR